MPANRDALKQAAPGRPLQPIRTPLVQSNRAVKCRRSHPSSLECGNDLCRPLAYEPILIAEMQSYPYLICTRFSSSLKLLNTVGFGSDNREPLGEIIDQA